MTNKLIDHVFLILLGLALLNVILYFRQPSMVFIPYKKLTQTPLDWGMKYEEVYLNNTEDIRLHGWFIPAAASEQVVLFFHGNAGNISHRGESIEIFHKLGLNVFIFDYQGYGNSEGQPNESRLYADAVAAWRYLTNERGYHANDIFLFGRSLGGVVAANLASKTHSRGLILESTFSTAKDVANAIFPVLSRLVYLRYDFNTVAHMGRVSCPVLILHSPHDEIIPYSLGEKVYRAAKEPKSFIPMAGDHNSGFLISQPEYERALARFISSTNS